MYPEVNKDSLRKLNDEAETDYQHNKDWRALCDHYMKMRKDGDEKACPDIAEEGFIERSVGEEYMDWQERLDALSAGDERVAMLRSKLEGWHYDPDTTRFEDLPYYMNQETPGSGSVPELEAEQTMERESCNEELQSFYADMYERRDVLPYGVKASVPGYEDYAKERTRERTEEIIAEHIGEAMSFNSYKLGVDYSRTSSEHMRHVNKVLDKPFATEISEQKKTSLSSASKNPDNNKSSASRKQLNSVERGVSNPDYDFDEFDDEGDDGDFER